MRKAEVYQGGVRAGMLEELENGKYRFSYAKEYSGRPISLTLPVRQEPFEFDSFPPVFEGLLPEGAQLEMMLRRYKLDRNDLFGQLLIVGADMVGSLAVKEVV